MHIEDIINEYIIILKKSALPVAKKKKKKQLCDTETLISHSVRTDFILKDI